MFLATTTVEEIDLGLNKKKLVVESVANKTIPADVATDAALAHKSLSTALCGNRETSTDFTFEMTCSAL